MEERQSRLSSMVWRRLRPYFCVRLILLNSMFSNFCHVLKTILYNHTNTPYDNPNFYIEEELIRKIEKSIQDLPENYRQAFEMNRFQDMTYKEIASHLNISSKTVDYRIQQALKILRIKLKDYMPLLIGLLT